MRVVITGHKGQLGRQLQAAFAGHEILGLDMPEDDITAPTIRGRIVGFRPDLILHAAAYTDVDGCETNPELAFRVNAVGTQNVALAAAQTGAALLYISTNEVFDGSRRELYREWDVVNPTSVYARSKAAGEQIVRDLADGRFYICRLAWLFGPGGNNFVTKILAGAEKYGALRVAADEFGNPTYAPDLAQAIVRLAATGQFGIYHLTNAGFCSRYEFAAKSCVWQGSRTCPSRRSSAPTGRDRPNRPCTPSWPTPPRPRWGLHCDRGKKPSTEYIRLLTLRLIPDA